MKLKIINHATVIKEGEFSINRINRHTLLYDEFFRYIEIEVESGYDKASTLSIYFSIVKNWNSRIDNLSIVPLTEEEKEKVKENISEGMKALKINFEFE